MAYESLSKMLLVENQPHPVYVSEFGDYVIGVREKGLFKSFRKQLPRLIKPLFLTKVI